MGKIRSIKRVRRSVFILILILLISITSAVFPLSALGPSPPATASDPLHPARIVGYYAAWASYSGFKPDKIDAGSLTHINYAFAKIDKNGRIEMGYPDRDPENFRLLQNLKKKNPTLKTMISVGGWTWSGRFSDAARTDASRAIFAESCVSFLKQYGFDGIDIDWEYPVSGGLSGNAARPEDRQNFTLLLKELREKLDEQGSADQTHYLLTIAGAAGSSYPKNTELEKLAPYLDYASIMTYDLHGSWDHYADLLAPLYCSTESSPQYKISVDSSAALWIKSGFPKEKLVLGIPFYGYQYQAVKGGQHGLYGRFEGANSIPYERIRKEYLTQKQYHRYFHNQSKVPWLFNGSVFITYEDAESIRFKTEYITQNGLGGAMLWELSQDPDQILLHAVYHGLAEKKSIKGN